MPSLIAPPIYCSAISSSPVGDAPIASQCSAVDSLRYCALNLIRRPRAVAGDFSQ